MSPKEKDLTISPSKLERVVLCPGSARMTKDLPWRDSAAARRGRALHDAMALLFSAGEVAWDKVRTNVGNNADCKMGDLSVLEEAFELGKSLLPDDPDTQIIIEQKLDLEFLGLSGGTPDFIFLSPKFKQAVLGDWKFGSGAVEDPGTNWQLKPYAAGIMAAYKDHGLTAIEPAIIQPGAFKRDDSMRSAVWNAEEIRGFVPQIRKAVTEAKMPNAPTIAGPTQCRWCDAKDTCASYKAYAAGKAEVKATADAREMAAITTDGTPITVEPKAPLEFPAVLINAETVAQAEEKKALILSMRVTDESTANAMGKLAKDARGLAALINKNREAIKKPVLDLGRQIDAAAKLATDPLEEAAKHADDQVRAWVQAQAAIAAKAKAEEERKQREAQEAADAAARESAKKEAEAQAALRAAAEAEERAANLKTKAARDKAMAEAAKQRAEAEAAQKAAEEQEQARLAAERNKRAAEASATAVEAPGKVAGFRNTTTVTWEIPDLTKVPADLAGVLLMPNAKVIDTMIKTGVISEAKHGAWIKIQRTADVARSR